MPVQKVTVPAFWMGQYEVTGAQYRLFYFCRADADNPPGIGTTKPLNAPVTFVSWDDANQYCEWLNHVINSDTQDTHFFEKSGYLKGTRCRLPSEAEWEYAACYKGPGTDGLIEQHVWAGTSEEARLKEYAWYQENSGNRIQPVGGKEPNPLGLYDMSGNVWEWCADHWQEGYEGAPTDGSARINRPDIGVRLLRGGACYNQAVVCRAAFRVRNHSVDRNDYVGFRVLFSAART